MNKQIKKKWVEALRSGDYVQGSDHLKVYDLPDGQCSFCCLGVLTDLYAKENNIHFHEALITEDGTRFVAEIAPPHVQDWAGLDRGNPLLRREEDHFTDAIANFNDRGTSFAELADMIEGQL